MDRRKFLTTALGCSLAASPLVTPVALAQAPWDARLVVIILRGGMDGLDAVRPVGDPEFAASRPRLGQEGGGALDLDGYFAAHPALEPLAPLWSAGDLAFSHAVSTPYRDKRSHFDGQDILEAGTAGTGQARGGWLNRMLQAVQGVRAETTFAVGQEQMLLTSGAAPVSRWSPGTDLRLSPQAQLLLEVVHRGDPLVQAASAEAIALAARIEEAERDGNRPRPHVEIARFAADRLREESRIAAFSLNGWDTHARQDRSLPRALGRLSDVVLEMRDRLGPVWDRTALIAMTEFGRTVRENGTGGTDHGTAGAALLAGGAIRGGRVITDWPGLAEADLYDRRDLMPTRDIRAHVGWLMAGLMGLDRATIEGAIFPGVELGPDPGLLL